MALVVLNLVNSAKKLPCFAKSFSLLRLKLLREPIKRTLLTLVESNLKKHQKFEKMKPPVAAERPHKYEIHGTVLEDEYFWMRDSKWPEVEDKDVLEYVKEENAYTEEFFAPHKSLKNDIFEELKGRIKLDDQTPYVKKGDYYYYSRTESDKEYSIHCRKHKSTDAPEEIILDINVLAKDKKFTDVDVVKVSPDHNLLAYSVDFAGLERYNIKVLNLQTKEYLVDEIINVSGNIIWHEKLNGFFYSPLNEHLRTDTLKFHTLGEKQENDKTLFHIDDVLYQLRVHKSSSKEYVFINVSGHNTNEIHVIKMSDTTFKTELIRQKKEDIFYDVEHNDDLFYIKTNDQAKNFRIVTVGIDKFYNDQWENNYVPEISNQYLCDFGMTKNYLILTYRVKGLPIVVVKSLDTEKQKDIQFSDGSYTASAKSTNFEENDIRINYSSLARPNTTYTYDYPSGQLNVIKVQEIPSGHDPKEYTVERIYASTDGVEVPITVLYKTSLFEGPKNPLCMYGYGSYGHAYPVNFKNQAISLVNRGFVYAIAHIRGGDDLGHDWYEEAKFLKKKRTFEDFIACAETLCAKGYTTKGNIVCGGGSAGGLLIGAVINSKPELFKAALLHVPFVDVLNTMLDETLPLTPGEFKEWGNPKELDYFNYIRSYSPYDNIKAQKYPHIFTTAGLSDPRVGYWEAAKWVARLRKIKTDDNVLIMKTNMDSGHMGSSGRYDYLKEIADDIVFILKVFNMIPQV
ncbi:hypothetical protein TKK_0001775 [Trichogramma kaykai]|uniref:Prolyl endopeptidase n=1 Tax=Trichogramma kaykai TaxID=54128 RepID=A0ABD2XFB8_9HYME